MNVARYIGKRFKDKGRGPCFDCWGLFRYVMEIEFGITGIPDFNDGYETCNDRTAIPLLVEQEKPNWKQVEHPKEGDAVMFNIGGKPIHIGVCTSPTHFLHIHKDINASHERLDSPVWKNRIEGFYRYE